MSTNTSLSATLHSRIDHAVARPYRALRARHAGAGLGLALAGVAIGIGVALPIARMLEPLLLGVGTNDWRIYGGVTLGVTAAALLALLVPAVRAGGVNPGAVMRDD